MKLSLDRVVVLWELNVVVVVAKAVLKERLIEVKKERKSDGETEKKIHRERDGEKETGRRM